MARSGSRRAAAGTPAPPRMIAASGRASRTTPMASIETGLGAARADRQPDHCPPHPRGQLGERGQGDVGSQAAHVVAGLGQQVCGHRQPQDAALIRRCGENDDVAGPLAGDAEALAL